MAEPADFHDFEAHVDAYFASVCDLLEKLDRRALAEVYELLWNAWESDRTVFVVGNGGSAATASHIACDFGKQTQVPFRPPLRAHALTDNVALMSALGNDIDYTYVFSEQLNIHARPDDLLIAISCSGGSANIVAAIEAARSIGMTTIGFGGFDGGRMRELVDCYVHVPSHDYGLVESIHLVFDHCLTSMLHEAGRLSGAGRRAVFLDRDGVIVRNRTDYVKRWDEVELIPGALEAIAGLTRTGHRVFVVTNQSAVGRGLMAMEDLCLIHDRLRHLARAAGGRIEGFLVCPHVPEAGCECRKPAPGLLMRAREAYGVDLEGAVFVGDHETDAMAARAVGMASVLVLTGRTLRGAIKGDADYVVEDLPSAAALIIDGREAVAAAS